MPEHNLSQLLDRAVEHAPGIDLGGEQMLTAGKRRVRQRRAVAGGSAVGALALAAAVWTAANGSGLFATSDTSPAGTTTTQTQTTTGTTGEDPSAPVVTKDRTITLRGADEVYTFSDGFTTLGQVVLHLRADGTSSAEVAVNGAASIDGPGASLDGVPILGGAATAYRGEVATLVTAALPAEETSAALLGVGEAMGGTFRAENQLMQWWVILHGPDTGTRAGLPSDIIMVTGESATLVSGAALDSGRVPEQDLTVWSAPTVGQWGLTGPDGTTSTSGEVLMSGDETVTTWAARVPLEARAVRLVAPDTGEVLERTSWFVTLGDQQIAGGTSTWDVTDGSVVEWLDADGTPSRLSGDVTGGTGAFAGWTFTVDPEQGMAVEASYQGDQIGELPTRLSTSVRAFPLADDPAHVLVALPVGIAEDAVLRLLEPRGTGYLPVDGRIVAEQTLQTNHGALRLLKVPSDAFATDDGDLLALRYPDTAGTGAFNTWHLLGADIDQGTMAIDPGLAVQVAEGQGWLLYPGGDTGDGTALLGGKLGGTVLEWASPEDPETVTLVAVLEAGDSAGAELVVPAGFRIESSQTHVGPVEGYEVFTATVNRPVDGGPAGAAYGLDLDGDGTVDVPVR